MYEPRKLVLLQLRSTLAKHLARDFISDILTFAKDSGVSEVVCLASSDAEERVDTQLEGSQLRYLTSPNEEKLGSLGWKSLEKRKEEEIFLPGGGFAKKLHLKAQVDNDVHATIKAALI